MGKTKSNIIAFTGSNNSFVTGLYRFQLRGIGALNCLYIPRYGTITSKEVTYRSKTISIMCDTCFLLCMNNY